MGEEDPGIARSRELSDRRCEHACSFAPARRCGDGASGPAADLLRKIQVNQYAREAIGLLQTCCYDVVLRDPHAGCSHEVEESVCLDCVAKRLEKLWNLLKGMNRPPG